MPRKTKTGLKHTKSVVRRGVEYVYFNTGERHDGRTIYAPLGRKDSVEFGAKYSAALAARSRRANVPTSVPLPELADQYMRSRDFTGTKSPGTQKTYRVYLRRLAKEFDTAPANALEASDIYDLMDEMGDRPAAIDMLLLAGGQMYEWARKRKKVAHNPFAGIDRKDWDAAEYEPWPEALLDEALADPKIGVPAALLYFTAQRIGDVCRLRWDDIRGDAIHMVQQKTGKEMIIPLHSELAAVLEAAPRRGETILADAKGKVAKDQTVRGWLKAFGEARGFDVVPHGLRKNAVNALLEAECSVAETSAISGQSLRMVEHYARKRNNRVMGREAMAKWERSGNRETRGKTLQEMAE